MEIYDLDKALVFSYLNSLSAKELNGLGVSDITVIYYKRERVYTMKELITLHKINALRLIRKQRLLRNNPLLYVL